MNRVIGAVLLCVAMLAPALLLALAFELANRADCPIYPYLSRCVDWSPLW